MNTAQTIQKSPAEAAGFDIEDLDVEGEATLKVALIKDEEGEAISGFIIVGKDSPQYQAETQAIRTENIQRSAKRNKAIDTKTEDGARLVAETLAKNERRLALAVTVGWFGFKSEGAPIAFRKDMVEKMYLKKQTWVDEVTAKLDANEGFTKV